MQSYVQQGNNLQQAQQLQQQRYTTTPVSAPSAPASAPAAPAPVQYVQPQVMAMPQQYSQPVINQPQVASSPNPNYAGVNIQIFNPSVGVPGATTNYNVNSPNYQTGGLGPCYPANYYTQPMGQNANNVVNNTTNNKTINETENKETNKKTEKRKIVQLTDDYIRNLENYLNSQDKEVRMMGAKEVVARFQEDDSRKNDKALTALINKMLQDPAQQIRIMALSMLESRTVTGDDYTVGVLKNMQNSKEGYGQDALQATNILLKMSGQTVEKEFEVKDTPKKETTTQAK